MATTKWTREAIHKDVEQISDGFKLIADELYNVTAPATMQMQCYMENIQFEHFELGGR